MTNTLHRYSEHYAFAAPPHPEPIRDDYIVFAMASRGINDDNLVEKYRTRAEARADIFDYIERCHNPRQRRRLDMQQQGQRLLTQPSVITG